MKYIIYTDGGARGNPGPAAIGVVIKDGKTKTLVEYGEKIGETTNNVAEYTAVISALNYLLKYLPYSEMKKITDTLEINFFLDSLLVVNQLNGLFKVKEPHLRQLLLKVHELVHQIGGQVTFSHIPRAQNYLADRLVNAALDRSS